MTILVLGGTTEAKQLAHRLIAAKLPLIYSIAGLVRQPQLNCRIISGGFSRLGGLEKFIIDESVQLVIDATHPYAERMSEQVKHVTATLNMPYWSLQKEEWSEDKADDWSICSNWAEVFRALKPYKRVFLTSGQLTTPMSDDLVILNQQLSQQHVLRTAVPNKQTLAEHIQTIEQIGPFTVEHELALLQRLGIDVLVSKNSGGDASWAKMLAARQLGVKVLLLARPEALVADRQFLKIDACFTACQQFFVEAEQQPLDSL